MRHVPKELRPLVHELADHGYRTAKRAGGHLAVIDAATGQVVASLPSTPGDHRAVKNARAKLRRLGLLG